MAAAVATARAPRPVSLVPPPARPRPQIGQILLDMGAVSAADLMRGLRLQARHPAPLGEVLVTHGLVTRPALRAALERQFGTAHVDPDETPPDPRLIDRLGIARALRLGCLPWARAGAVCVVATTRPDRFDTHRAELEQALGPVVMALIDDPTLFRVASTLRGAALADRASDGLAAPLSCRGWGNGPAPRVLALGLGGLIVAALAAPQALLLAALALAVAVLIAGTALKLAAFAAGRRAKPHAAPEAQGGLTRLPDMLPVISIMVPMFGEPETVPRLINRLSRLSYPRTRLDVMLVLEACDHTTLTALDAMTLPRWMRVIVVPDGPLRTKPRALNHALNFARGTLIGVYDVEDAPEPDQLLRVAGRFARADARLGCVQGMLDFYNPRSTWLTRCFTIDYATWFRVLLPGKQALGLALPLGGTTLFLRREVLDQLGGWDAHNVTEDADLGLRLARMGYRTEVLDTTTFEEATCHLRAWIRQRSRWLKGYAITYAVHMRDPRALWRALGPWAFAGVQVQFLGALLSVLLAPAILSCWVLAMGLGHPAGAVLPGWMLQGLVVVFISAAAIDVALALVALRSRHHRGLWCALPLMWAYWPLATLAAYKALWELIHAPHYWDKTAHGRYTSAIDAVTAAKL